MKAASIRRESVLAASGHLERLDAPLLGAVQSPLATDLHPRSRRTASIESPSSLHPFRTRPCRRAGRSCRFPCSPPEGQCPPEGRPARSNNPTQSKPVAAFRTKVAKGTLEHVMLGCATASIRCLRLRKACGGKRHRKVGALSWLHLRRTGRRVPATTHCRTSRYSRLSAESSFSPYRCDARSVGGTERWCFCSSSRTRSEPPCDRE